VPAPSRQAKGRYQVLRILVPTTQTSSSNNSYLPTKGAYPGSEFDAYVADYGSFVQEMAHSELSARWTTPSEEAWAPLLEVRTYVGQTAPVLT
jgi:hypothetical protein